MHRTLLCNLAVVACLLLGSGGASAENRIALVVGQSAYRMDGSYKGALYEASIDTNIFVAKAKEYGSYCAVHPSAGRHRHGDSAG